MKTTKNCEIINDILRDMTPEDYALASIRLDVADAIYDAIEKMGLSYSEVARRLHVSEETVADWTSGAMDVPADCLCRIEQTLNVQLDLPESMYA